MMNDRVSQLGEVNLGGIKRNAKGFHSDWVSQRNGSKRNAKLMLSDFTAALVKMMNDRVSQLGEVNLGGIKRNAKLLRSPAYMNHLLRMYEGGRKRNAKLNFSDF